MAAVFFDTSALVRRYDRAEVGAARVRAMCRRTGNNLLLIARVTPVEVAAALNRKVRERRFDSRMRDQQWRLFRSHWRDQYRVSTIGESIWQDAERLLFTHSLRSYDAVQLATALQLAATLAPLAPDYRFCTADRAQARAAELEGLAVELIT